MSTPLSNTASITASAARTAAAETQTPSKPVESISTFDIFKIGVGPSSSHTMGPWRAAEKFVQQLAGKGLLVAGKVLRVKCDLYGSLAKTGIGHGTDIAVMLGFSGENPVDCDTSGIDARIAAIRSAGRLRLAGTCGVPFDYERDIVFNKQESLAFHPNGMTLTAYLAATPGSDTADVYTQTYFSIGGGFIVQERDDAPASHAVQLTYPIETGNDVLRHCRLTSKTIPEIVMENEMAWRTEPEVRRGLLNIYRVMLECVHRGCHTPGVLPGGLFVTRRASGMNEGLLAEKTSFDPAAVTHETEASVAVWKAAVRTCKQDFQHTLKWVSCFALAVNEENAAFGRVVTAPTNGAAGVIPAVLCYYDIFSGGSDERIIDFMLAASVVGVLFKKGATISAAMGGCQAEIGVSSAMAAAGLTQVMGGSPARVLMAAEIAMEHHLGMTCDPIGGLVQIPCIERNTMGAIKAITAANIAMDSDPAGAKVSLDGVIRTMWETALDMHSKYKETSDGGLAVNVSVGITEC